jgi:two-component system, OmpR family, sensor histidine kinase QseC
VKPRSLQGRLLWLVLGVVGTVWLLAAVWTVLDVRHELDELLDSHLAQAAALLVAQQSHELGEDEGDDAPRIDAPLLHRYATKATFQVFHDGRLVLRSANAPATPLLPAGAAASKGFATVDIEGTAWRVFAAQGAERDVRVFIGEQLASRADIARAALRSTLLPLALALPLLALAVWWAVVRGMAPLRALSQQLVARRPQALAPLALPGAPSELRPLVDALNGLFDRITALMDSERRFTADAAHELRTPIAAIRAQAQVALGEPDAAARRHALDATLAGCDRAARLVDQLLTLSRLEEAGAAVPHELLDLAALVRREAAALAPAAIDKGQTLDVEAEACTVRGDATLLAVLVRNLVDNAIRYSPPGARVAVTVAAHSGRVQLRVQDGGPGLADADRQRLGERFFRVLGSGQGGSGLGWSIVRRIAAVHAWTLQVGVSAALGGLDVGVEGPAA